MPDEPTSREIRVQPQPLSLGQQQQRVVRQEHNNCEYIASLKELFNGYFTTFLGHLSSYSGFEPDTWYSYTKLEFSNSFLEGISLRIGEEKLIDTLEDKKQFNKLLNMCFFDVPTDFTGSPPDLDEHWCQTFNNPRPNVRVIELTPLVILLKKVKTSPSAVTRDVRAIVGYYVAETNTMFTSDWAHSSKGIEYVESLRDTIIDTLQLRKKIARVRRVPITPITIGCDPEFELVNRNGSVVSADGVISGRIAGSIGTDGAGSQVELRPRAGDIPELVTNLDNLFIEFEKRYPKYRLSVSGHVYPIGGHIHVGVGHSYNPPDTLLSMLDDFLGRPTLDLSGRARGAYKGLSKKETKNWGFEYRTCPAAIFYNKKIATICLKIVKNIIHKFINTRVEIVYHRPPTDEDYANICNLTEDETFFFNTFNRITKQYIHTFKTAFVNWFEESSTSIKEDSLTQTMSIPVDKQESGVSTPSYCRVSIAFSDDWNNTMKVNIRRMITQFITSKVGIIHISITLFGFRRDRGLVSNIHINDELTLVNNYEFNPVISPLEYRIGLPYDYRVEFVEEHATMIANGIIHFLAGRISELANSTNVEGATGVLTSVPISETVSTLTTSPRRTRSNNALALDLRLPISVQNERDDYDNDDDDTQISRVLGHVPNEESIEAETSGNGEEEIMNLILNNRKTTRIRRRR